MLPPVGVSSPSTSFAVVVLPQPDSPTTPSVLPPSMAKVTPSTARTTPRLAAEDAAPRREMLAEAGSLQNGGHATLLLSIAALASALGTASQQRAVRPSSTANSGGASSRQRPNAIGAAGCEGAAGRQGGEIGRLAFDGGEVVAVVRHARDRAEQRLGVGVRRASMKICAHRSLLDDPAGIHHGELVAHLGDDAEIVGDEDQRQPVLALQLAQQA